MLVETTTNLPFRDAITDRIAAWWDEAEIALHESNLPRARRYLRWILAVRPDDEEAWLCLAELAPTQREQLAYLRQAYSFNPDSQRTMQALRRARIQQLESSVDELVARPAALGCLPDHRQPGNGNGRTEARHRSLPSRIFRTVGSSPLGSLFSFL